MEQQYKTPLGRKSTDPKVLGLWNQLADAIASKGWIHHGTDDRYGTLTFRSTSPNEFFLPAHSPGVETLHVEHALSLYERIYGRPFTEEP